MHLTSASILDSGEIHGQVWSGAGLPRAMGGGDEDPELFYNYLLAHATNCLLGSVGGSWGGLPIAHQRSDVEL